MHLKKSKKTHTQTLSSIMVSLLSDFNKGAKMKKQMIKTFLLMSKQNNDNIWSKWFEDIISLLFIALRDRNKGMTRMVCKVFLEITKNQTKHIMKNSHFIIKSLFNPDNESCGINILLKVLKLITPVLSTEQAFKQVFISLKDFKPKSQFKASLTFSTLSLLLPLCKKDLLIIYTNQIKEQINPTLSSNNKQIRKMRTKLLRQFYRCFTKVEFNDYYLQTCEQIEQQKILQILKV
eukprot:Anaeramoba_flamelloidesa328681_31.p1 GENE.a328681_31~~a328681_31.p1  ORF type:complete len:266 (+),score=56.13 a328681_31:95-799(+)